MSILQIGAGGVGSVIAHKVAQNNHILGDLVLASRTQAKCDRIFAGIERCKNQKDPSRKLESRSVDAHDVDSVIHLIDQVRPRLLINAGPPCVNVNLMEACVRTGTPYMDTSVATDLCSEGQQVPEAYEPQWSFRERYAKAGLTAILGAGFDPGVVSIFAAYAWKHLIDEIDSIDVLDVNAGNHGRKFATNFDPETNLLEMQGDSFYWEAKQWKRVPCHTRKMEFTFPEVGPFTLYSMAHDEVRSLAEYIPAKRIEFWMGISEDYLRYFNVLRDVGMLSLTPVTTSDRITVSPLKVLKALLPEPASLAPSYTGKTCIGTLVRGRSKGQPRSVFLYNICDHRAAYEEVESQAISYTAGVPAVTAALLLSSGEWAKPGVNNIEQLDPDPFLKLMPKMGLTWAVMDAASL